MSPLLVVLALALALAILLVKIGWPVPHVCLALSMGAVFLLLAGRGRAAAVHHIAVALELPPSWLPWIYTAGIVYLAVGGAFLSAWWHREHRR